MCRSPLENVTNEFVFTTPPVHLLGMICKIGGKWPYCFQDLFKIDLVLHPICEEGLGKYIQDIIMYCECQ